MKKTLLVLSAVLALSMAFVGCKKSSGTNEPDGSEPATELQDLVIYQAEGDDAFVLECEAGYNNYLSLIANIAAASGYKKIYAEAKWEAAGGKQAAIQLMSGDDEAMEQASATVNLSTSYTVVSGDCLSGAKYNKWVDGQAVETPCADTATKLQFYIQNDSYQPIAGKIYVKKVWLSVK